MSQRHGALKLDRDEIYRLHPQLAKDVAHVAMGSSETIEAEVRRFTNRVAADTDEETHSATASAR
jgi:hypothetical protein